MTLVRARAQGQAIWFALLGILCLATALRLFQLDGKSLWGDEILQASVASRSIDYIMLWVFNDWGPTPLSYLLVHGWMPLVGQSEYALRVLPVLFGVLSLALYYRFSQRLLGRATALLATLLLALSPQHLLYSQELRPYSLFLLWVILVAFMFWEALAQPARRHWLLLGLLVGLGFYNHQYILLFWGLLTLFGLLLVLWPPAHRALAAHLPHLIAPSRLFYGLFLVGVTTVLTITPWYARVRALVGSEAWATVEWSGGFLWTSTQVALAALLTEFLPLALLLGVGWLVGLVRLRQGNWPLALFLGGWSVLPLPLFQLIDVWGDYPFFARQMLLALPAFTLVSAVGLHWVLARLTLDQSLARLAGALLLLLALSAPALHQAYRTPNADWRLLGHYLTQVAGPEEIVLAPASWPYIGYYYAGQASLRGEQPPEAMQQLLESHEGAWLVWSDLYLRQSPAVKQQVEAFLEGKQGVEVLVDQHDNRILYLDRTGRPATEVREWLRQNGKLSTP